GGHGEVDGDPDAARRERVVPVLERGARAHVVDPNAQRTRGDDVAHVAARRRRRERGPPRVDARDGRPDDDGEDEQHDGRGPVGAPRTRGRSALGLGVHDGGRRRGGLGHQSSSSSGGSTIPGGTSPGGTSTSTTSPVSAHRRPPPTVMSRYRNSGTVTVSGSSGPPSRSAPSASGSVTGHSRATSSGSPGCSSG